ncbi:MAG: HAD family hydrolase, partial [Salinibacterium sp.]
MPRPHTFCMTAIADGAYWSVPAADVLADLESSELGLSSDQAAHVLARVGANALESHRDLSTWRLLGRQFLSPIVLILVAATVLAGVLGDLTDTIIILTIILASGLLSFVQERGASRAMRRLLETVQVKATVLRDGVARQIPFSQIVPGDVVKLDAGDLVPGDCVLLASHGLLVDEAALTGETFPVEKTVGTAAADSALTERSNAAFLGTHCSAGSGTVLVVRTGRDTEIGAVSSDLTAPSPQTGFEIGMTKFGLLLTRAMVVLVVVIFAANLALHRPIIDSALFSLALAVGLTPQLLPAIVSISLAQGARIIAKRRVIVRRLDAIEDFGSMNVLCSDKTGTMTVGTVVLDAATEIDGSPSAEVQRLACLNAALQVGLENPIDAAIVSASTLDSSVTKLDELAYDFDRRRLSVLTISSAPGSGPLLVTKGALEAVLDVCSRAQQPDGTVVDLSNVQAAIEQRFAELSANGFRVLGLAIASIPNRTVTIDDERDMTFVGLLSFADPVKPDAAATLADFASNRVSVRMLTGDNALVAAHIAGEVGLDVTTVLSGKDIDALDDRALASTVREVQVFAALNPLQKERIVRALRAAGNVVGYLGDGINDAPSLHAADVGISVDSAVAIAKESAAIVLLDKDLAVLLDGT